MGSKANPELIARNAAIVEMFCQGICMPRISDKYGISRERVRQILDRAGISSASGGAHKAAQSKKAKKQTVLEARCLAKYGLPVATVQALIADRTVHAFRQQRNTAKSRGIQWTLTLAEWYQVWVDSGKLALRGRGLGKYCMSRIKDAGPYAVGNVHIQLSTDNARDGVAKWRGKTKEHRGVFLLYPGLSRPWMAQVGGKAVGYFSTQAEAVQARQTALAGA